MLGTRLTHLQILEIFSKDLTADDAGDESAPYGCLCPMRHPTCKQKNATCTGSSLIDNTMDYI